MGLAVGAKIPAFRARDQDGTLRDFASLRGPKGAAIYFHRSASWCIYCQLQLVRLEESKEALRRNGLGVGAISYDSREALSKFAKERRISIPLLSDRGSRIIRDFKVLDANVPPDNPANGVPLHGVYLVDENGIVVAKYLEISVGHSAGIVVMRPSDHL